MRRAKSGQTSLRALAKEMGVSASYLSQVAHGKRPPSKRVLSKFMSSVKQPELDENPLFRYNPRLLGNRLAVGQRTLDPLAQVRILVPQPDGSQVLADTMSSTITVIMPAEIPSRKLQPSKRTSLPQDYPLLHAQTSRRRTSHSPHRLCLIASQ